MARAKDDILVGLDIGTTKVACIIGEVTDEGVDIIGIGSHPSTGLRKGVVINIDATINSIKKAVEEAEVMAGVEVNTVYAGIAGGHIRGFNSHGIVALKQAEVTQDDLARVVDAASAVAIPMDREVLHVIPQEYIIDEQDGIKKWSTEIVADTVQFLGGRGEGGGGGGGNRGGGGGYGGGY